MDFEAQVALQALRLRHSQRPSLPPIVHPRHEQTFLFPHVSP